MIIKWVNLFFGLLAFPNPANALLLVIVMPGFNSIMDLIKPNGLKNKLKYSNGADKNLVRKRDILQFTIKQAQYMSHNSLRMTWTWNL